MILTDADGNKFELVPLYENFQGTVSTTKFERSELIGHLAKPVQPEEEKSFVSLEMWAEKPLSGRVLFRWSQHLTRTEETALANAVKALVDFVTKETYTDEYLFNADFDQVPVVAEARQALQGKKVG